MSNYTARIEWKRGADAFAGSRYSRRHTWTFDGGAVVRGSSSPASVKPPMSDPAGVDPEEALIAATSSCHMLWFLAIASKRGFIVDSYIDEAVAEMGVMDHGRTGVTRITLRPAIAWSGTPRPTPADIESMHHEAHEKCFIANSIRSEVTVEPR